MLREFISASKSRPLDGLQIARRRLVARDGIEPPTPAFSGPRSTTELPGLSEDFQLQFLRGIWHGRIKVGWSTFSTLQRLTQYINSHSGKPIGATGMDLAISSLEVATGVLIR